MGEKFSLFLANRKELVRSERLELNMPKKKKNGNLKY